ncbi:hypothetical protein FOPE_08368 [Fonsecaea pedrosoi]|nr:hypothetical protein FOPE_08368 [Fonsecaea pedrosoi]
MRWAGPEDKQPAAVYSAAPRHQGQLLQGVNFQLLWDLIELKMDDSTDKFESIEVIIRQRDDAKVILCIPDSPFSETWPEHSSEHRRSERENFGRGSEAFILNLDDEIANGVDVNTSSCHDPWQFGGEMGIPK